MNDTKALPKSQGRDDFAEWTGEPATATFSADYGLPGPSSYSSVGQVNATSSRWTGDSATTTGVFRTPPNYGQLSSYPPQSMGHAVVASDTPTYFDQSITMEGATTPVAPDIEAYAGASVPVYGANPPLNRASITFPVVEWQPRNSPATSSAEAARRDLSLASKRSETSGEPKRYRCQWAGCSADPMSATEILLHFLAHGEKDKETDRVKAGCRALNALPALSCIDACLPNENWNAARLR